MSKIKTVLIDAEQTVYKLFVVYAEAPESLADLVTAGGYWGSAGWVADHLEAWQDGDTKTKLTENESAAVSIVLQSKDSMAALGRDLADEAHSAMADCLRFAADEACYDLSSIWG